MDPASRSGGPAGGGHSRSSASELATIERKFPHKPESYARPMDEMRLDIDQAAFGAKQSTPG